MKNIIDRHLERAIYMAVFAVAFSVIGYFVPKTYFEFIDKTEYIQIRQPVSTEFTEYKRGDNLGLIINRKSYINTTVTQHAKIVHVNGRTISTQLKDADYPQNLVIEKSDDYIVTKTNTLFVPCDAVPGRNFMQIMFTYKVNGVEKSYTYISEVFEVLDDKSDRCR